MTDVNDDCNFKTKMRLEDIQEQYDGESRRKVKLGSYSQVSPEKYCYTDKYFIDSRISHSSYYQKKCPQYS